MNPRFNRLLNFLKEAAVILSQCILIFLFIAAAAVVFNCMGGYPPFPWQ